MNKKAYSVAPWCSTNIYYVNKRTRAYIKNEITEEYFLLENTSAKIWKCIVEGKEYDDIIKYAKNFNESRQAVDNFLCDLQKESLITDLNTNTDIHTPIKNTEFKDIYQTKKDYTKFINDMTKWAIKNHLLQSLFINTTYNCNADCIHCFNKYNHKNHSNLDIKFEEIKPIIDEAYNIGVFSITLSGGETTISKDFLKIAKYIREKKISLEIYTNGINLYDNEKLFNEIVRLYPKFSFSLYSMNPEIHDKITGIKGSHKKLMIVLNKLKQYNVVVEVKSFLTKYNYLAFKEISEYAKENGFHALYDTKFVNKKENNNSETELSEEMAYKAYKNYYDENKSAKLKKRRQDAIPCGAGHTQLAINPDLKVHMCCLFNLEVGDLRKNTIKEIWTEKAIGCEELTKFRKIRVRDLKDCYKHEYCYFCNYCPGFSINENNYLKKSNNLCKIAKIKMKVYKEQTKKSLV